MIVYILGWGSAAYPVTPFAAYPTPEAARAAAARAFPAPDYRLSEWAPLAHQSAVEAWCAYVAGRGADGHRFTGSVEIVGLAVQEEEDPRR